LRTDGDPNTISGGLVARIKHVLLGFTALAALGAHKAAADGISLAIGGRYESAAGVVISEDVSASSGIDQDDLRAHVFKQDIEIDFAFETVLDNGLTVGAAIEFAGQSTDDPIEEAYLSLSGSFGEVRFGDIEEAYAQLCYLVPSASLLFGADSPNFNFSNAGIAGFDATNDTCGGIDDTSTKLVYFSPVFSGFHFALSYAPDATQDTTNTVDGAGTRPTNDAGQNSENLSIAATFAHGIDGVELVVGGGATFSFDKEAAAAGAEKARGYNLHAQAAFRGFTIGAASELLLNLDDDGADQWVYGVGATQIWAAWAVGLGWTRGHYEDAVGANGVGPYDAVHDIYSATVSRALAPGISIDGVIEYSDYDSDDASGPDYRGLAGGIGVYIGF
jgi:hypothetical protein